MTRVAAEQTIRDTFPPDSRDQNRAEVGERLANQAGWSRQVRVGDRWRNAPTPFLVRFAELCLAEEAKQHETERMVGMP